MKVTTVDIYDKEGQLLRTEAYKESGEHLLDFIWDEREEQTHDNRVEFRKWVVRHLKQAGHEVHE